jgi:hypothetical protein
MRPVRRYRFAVREDPDKVPNHLLVAEGRPAVRLGLGDELLEGPALGRREEVLAGVAVVELDLARRRGLLFEEGALLGPVPTVLGLRVLGELRGSRAKLRRGRRPRA